MREPNLKSGFYIIGILFKCKTLGKERKRVLTGGAVWAHPVWVAAT